MATDFIISVQDQPGSFASVAKILGDAGVNIDGVSGWTYSGQGYVRFITNNAEAAKSALSGAGIKYDAKDVILLDLPNQPGQLSKYTSALGDAGINISVLYTTMGDHQVFETSDNAKAQEIANQFGVLQS